MAANLESLIKQHQALLVGRWITDLANTASFLYHELNDLNWLGFYLMSDGDLWLGPFQGKPACTQIKVGRGVCGQAVSQRKTMVVADVDQFPDHIVCDSASRSEIVIPIIVKDQVVGVLDVDAPILSRFSVAEQEFFEKVVENLIAMNRNSAIF